jgi:hypothetical protein
VTTASAGSERVFNKAGKVPSLKASTFLGAFLCSISSQVKAATLVASWSFKKSKVREFTAAA